MLDRRKSGDEGPSIPDGVVRSPRCSGGARAWAPHVVVGSGSLFLSAVVRLPANDGHKKEVMVMAKSSKSSDSYRSAVTGRYVTPKYGKGHPNTTVKESK